VASAGLASREKRTGVFELRVSSGARPVFHGKVLQQSETFKGNKGAAENRLSELVVEASRNRLGDRRQTVAWALDQWLNHRKALRRSPTTIRNYESKIDKIKEASFAALSLPDLKPSDLNGFYRDLLEAEYSPTTVVHYHRILSAALKFAEDNEWINWGGKVTCRKGIPSGSSQHRGF
jgi:hypothetical protein